ncbi:MAG: helix-turn-helix transcriptional regulator [Solirubrobacteraceae bacterium]
MPPPGRLSVSTTLHEDVLFELYRRSPGATERLPSHTHAEYQFSIGLTATNAYEHRDGISKELPGRLTVLPPGLRHRPVAPPSHRVEARLLLVYVPAAKLRDMGRQMTGRAVPDLAGPAVLDSRIALGLRALHRDLRRGSALLERDDRLTSVLAALTATRHEPRRDVRGGSAQARAVARAREFLEEHALDEIRLERLSSEAGVSPFHLARSFTAHMGVAPHAYQLQLRVGRAKALLADGAAPAEAAARTGFCDQSHLGRHFRRLVGVTPGAYAGGARTS